MARLREKVAVVTGGAHGIGKAACVRMAEAGAHVAVTDMQAEQATRVADEINDCGGKARAYRLNVAEESEFRDIFDRINKEMGGIDVLVNNAGIAGEDMPTHEVPLEQ